jgi:hypothetical protein
MGRRSDIKTLPTSERIKELLSYDPETGILLWKPRPRIKRNNAFTTRCTGKAAGTMTPQGYLRIGIDGRYFLAHRLIWKMVTGEEPADQIDHEDTNKTNNRWRNLRPAENGQNIQNSRLRRDNKSGVKGLFWDERHKAWRAVITTNGNNQRLGRFKSLQEATKVIERARLAQHGEFARMT